MFDKRNVCVGVAGCLLVFHPSIRAEQPARGIELYKEKKYSEAAKQLQTAVEAEPANPVARYYLGLSLLELEKYQEAERYFADLEREAEESPPRLDQVKIGLARAQMERKQYDQARKKLDEALELKPDNPEVFLYRGRLNLHLENYGAAAKELDKAIELDPKQPYAHYYAGIAYSNLRRPDRMVNHFQMFLKLAPDAPEAPKVRSLLRGVR